MKLTQPIMISLILTITLTCVTLYKQIYQSSAEYSVSQAAPLPDLLQDWTDEQLEDEQVTYLEAIETLKDEQKRRAK